MRYNFRSFYFVTLSIILCGFHSYKAAAQTQTFYYTGPAFSIKDCTDGGYSAPPCSGGNVTGMVTLNVPTDSNYTRISGTNVVAFNLTANGIGVSTSDLSNLITAATYFYVYNGQMYGWEMAANCSPINSQIQTYSGYGDGANQAGPIYETKLGNVRYVSGTWTNAKGYGMACDHVGSASCGDPIDIGSGNMFYNVQDYATAGQNPLQFVRYYNSMSAPDTYALELGSHWRSTYDRFLHIVNPAAITNVQAERADGQVINFSSNSGIYTTDSDVDYKLSVAGATWTLTDPDDTVETYAASAGKGALQTIKARNGYVQTMHYTNSILTGVTDSYSRTLGLSYTSVGLLGALTTPDSLTTSYGYTTDTDGKPHLATVGYNTAPVTKQNYLYENASYLSALTGITDENGVRLTTWTYDNTGLATSSQHAGGANYTQILYDSSTGNRGRDGPAGRQGNL